MNDFPGLDEVFDQQLSIPPVDLDGQDDITQAVLNSLERGDDVGFEELIPCI